MTTATPTENASAEPPGLPEAAGFRSPQLRVLLAVMLVALAGAAAFTLGAAEPSDRDGSAGLLAAPMEPPMPSAVETDPIGLGIADAMMCGSFTTINAMTDALRTDLHSPGPRTSDVSSAAQTGNDFIRAAQGLASSERDSASTTLNTALDAYIHTLTVLGAAVKDNDSSAVIEDLGLLVDLTGATVNDLCHT